MCRLLRVLQPEPIHFTLILAPTPAPSCGNPYPGNDRIPGYYSGTNITSRKHHLYVLSHCSPCVCLLTNTVTMFFHNPQALFSAISSRSKPPKSPPPRIVWLEIEDSIVLLPLPLSINYIQHHDSTIQVNAQRFATAVISFLHPNYGHMYQRCSV
jgi:hypothetical protein